MHSLILLVGSLGKELGIGGWHWYLSIESISLKYFDNTLQPATLLLTNRIEGKLKMRKTTP